MSERIENEATNLMITTGHAALECEPSQPIRDQNTEREHTASRKVQESDQKNKIPKRIVLTPLSLLVLAACGGFPVGLWPLNSPSRSQVEITEGVSLNRQVLH